ncbi:hypothetical protein BKI52_34460 [marine bacterium AO1-C]|nr:hypothetical protein BKI52_34460 [marine bacterium AO1-C]
MTKEEKKQFNILILEDDPDIQQYIQSLVQGFGYQVSGVAASYDEAIELSKKSFPHVALCDINLENEKDGIDVANALKAMGQVAIIYLTMHAEEKIVDRALLTNPESYLIKSTIMTQARQLDIDLKNIIQNLQKNKITLKSRGNYYQVDYQDIIYIEADNNHCNVVTTQRIYNINQKFGSVLTDLKKFRIQQIHRSVAVNPDYIKAYDKKKVFIDMDKMSEKLDKRERQEIKSTLNVSDSFKKELDQLI